MGNRAVLTFSKSMSKDAAPAVGVYLHWKGSPEDIEEILELCRSRKYRKPEEDTSYAMARLIEAACEIAGSHRDTGIGVGILSEMDTNNGDNGTYVIGGNWKVIARHFN